MREQDPTLVIQTSHLGDTVLTTPLIQRLARRGPVDVVSTPAAAELLVGNPHVRRIYVLNKRSRNRMTATAKIALELRSLPREQRHRTAYLAQGSVRSGLLAMMAGIPMRVGFDTSAASFLYTSRCAYRSDFHHAQRLWLLAGPGEPGVLHPELFPSQRDMASAEELVEPGLPVIVLAPGSQRATKRWPYFAELAARIGSAAQIVVIGSAEDRPAAREIMQARAKGVTIDATGRISAMVSAAMIARAHTVICNDSLAMHMAAAFDVPVIALFGPTSPTAGFAPLSNSAVVMEPPFLACRPCAARAPHSCPKTHWRCMRDITPGLVARHVHQQLDHRAYAVALQ